MTMNKREKQALADAQREARVNRALRWSEIEPGRDLPPPTGGGLTKGWDYNVHRIVSGLGPASLNHAVFKAWSRATSHGTGWGEDRGASQRSRALFSNRLRALRALRCALEQWAAERLAAIDAEIEKERT